MKINNFLTSILLSFLFITSCHSTKVATTNLNELSDSTFTAIQTAPEIQITYQNTKLNTNIKTLLCHKSEDEGSLPILNLNTNEQLLISFDDLDADIKDYYYTIIHCNADWTPSNLMQSEYINGFYDEPITDFEFSFNTIEKYTHYFFHFPNEALKPMLSGNYVFKIFIEGGKTIAYQRFMILETKVTIEAQVRRATLAEDRNTKHEIDFSIKHPNIVIADPFADVKVTIKQNNREDNAITDLTPLFVKNDELIYDYTQENTFWGNNEFRHFDIKSLRYHSERIQEITFDSTYNHVHLFSDSKRPFDRYSIIPDINGQFIIKAQEGWKSSVEADYAWVHFSLPLDKIDLGDIYVIGAYNNWKLERENKLKYNTNTKAYEGSIFLKQGYYNYHYALNDTTINRVDVSYIEGTHYQTRNDYYIYVYHRGIANSYDKFVGFLRASSKELF